MNFQMKVTISVLVTLLIIWILYYFSFSSKLHFSCNTFDLFGSVVLCCLYRLLILWLNDDRTLVARATCGAYGSYNRTCSNIGYLMSPVGLSGRRLSICVACTRHHLLVAWNTKMYLLHSKAWFLFWILLNVDTI